VVRTLVSIHWNDWLGTFFVNGYGAEKMEQITEPQKKMFLSDEDAKRIYENLSPALLNEIITSWRNQAKYFSELRECYKTIEYYDEKGSIYCNTKFWALFNCIQTIRNCKLSDGDWKV